jgi:stage V sporulation protein G
VGVAPPIRITDVQISYCNRDKLKAWVTVVLSDCLLMRGLKVIEGRERLFVAMPSRPRRDGTFQDILHPITSAAREQIERAVLGAYQKGLEDEAGGPRRPMPGDPGTPTGPPPAPPSSDEQ